MDVYYGCLWGGVLLAPREGGSPTHRSYRHMAALLVLACGRRLLLDWRQHWHVRGHSRWGITEALLFSDSRFYFLCRPACLTGYPWKIPWEIPWDIPWEFPWDCPMGKSHVNSDGIPHGISYGKSHGISHGREIVWNCFELSWNGLELSWNDLKWFAMV